MALPKTYGEVLFEVINHGAIGITWATAATLTRQVYQSGAQKVIDEHVGRSGSSATTMAVDNANAWRSETCESCCYRRGNLCRIRPTVEKVVVIGTREKMVGEMAPGIQAMPACAQWGQINE